jgi:DNA-binding IscR family transcriptional regulator
VRLAWREATRALFKKLDAITIADLVADISVPDQ